MRNFRPVIPALRGLAKLGPLCIAICLAAVRPDAGAQEFPAPGKPIRIVVPFPAGGPNDIEARQIAPRLAQALGVPVIVDNKPGASTIIGAQEVARAAPDGHTLLYTSSVTHTQVPHLFLKLPFDPFRDFTPITQTATTWQVLVANPSLPARDMRELVAYAQANPGKLSYGSVGPGSITHLTGELLKIQTGIDIVHVPYKGAADALKDLLAGHIQLMFVAPSPIVANVKAGKLKALGVAGSNRIGALPDVATAGEQGISGLAIPAPFGIFGPANLPAGTVQRLNAELVKIVRSPEIRVRFAEDGTEASGTSPQEFAAIIRELYERWGELIRQLGLKLD
jgi:tripartite-type tricarboxylate transporter receptor subunit TctC